MIGTGDFAMKSRWYPVVLLLLIDPASFGQQSGKFPYLDPKLPPDRRAVVRRLTEKIPF
jgi:hypothetical protein